MNTMKTTTQTTPTSNIHSSKTQSSFGIFDLSTGNLVASGTRRNMREVRASYADPSRYSGVRRITFRVMSTETV